MIKQLLLQLVLIAVNAFFAATEIAVISLNEKKVKAKAEDGDKKAVKMLKMIEEPTRFLSTIQIGITLAGFLGSAFAADNFADDLTDYLVRTLDFKNASLVNSISVIFITIVLSYFTLVLGELVPKRVAMRNKEKLAELFCGFISFLAGLLTPIIWLLTISTNAVLRIMGIDPNEKEESVSEEDIVLMLDAGADDGTINEDDIEYIKNVFKLDKMTAEDVMTPRKSVVSINSDTTDEEILKIIEEEGYSRMPVMDDDNENIIGIFYVRDYLLKRTNKSFKRKSVIQQPVFVPESVHLDVLFKDMQKERFHMAVVVNEYGEVSGIVTMEDILEELVGEIWDELDEEIEQFTMVDENNFIVMTNVLVEEFWEYFELEGEIESEATTINGLITEQAGSIPEIGYSFDLENLKITVTKANDFMTEEISVRVSPKPTETEE
ncbi:MAG: HlyC/CorC family transporter [Clostridia bacterium]|nr:HlyC/CorC family transporter [Clostridia bacterium]